MNVITDWKQKTKNISMKSWKMTAGKLCLKSTTIWVITLFWFPSRRKVCRLTTLNNPVSQFKWGTELGRICWNSRCARCSNSPKYSLTPTQLTSSFKCQRTLSKSCYWTLETPWNLVRTLRRSSLMLLKVQSNGTMTSARQQVLISDSCRDWRGKKWRQPGATPWWRWGNRSVRSTITN